MFLLYLLACKQPEDSVTTKAEVDADHDGYVLEDDCDDQDPLRNPSQSEFCDGIDNNCDGRTDNDAEDANTYYRDGDGDGYGAQSLTTRECTLPAGYTEDATDCDDLLGKIHPGADEHCDGIDENCNGVADETPVAGTTWFEDGDGDGFVGTPLVACTQPSGAGVSDDDCDDTDATIFPGSHARETPNDGVDQDCDGLDICVDISCDGWPDLAFAGGTNSWLKGPDLGGGGVMGGSPAAAVAIGDLDEDGYLDLVLATKQVGASYEVNSRILFGGAAGPGAATLSLATTGATGVVSADLNGDSHLDLVFSEERSDSGWDVSSLVWMGDGSGHFVDALSLETVGAKGVVVLDVDGDGQSELFFPSRRGDGNPGESLLFSGVSYQNHASFPEADAACGGDLDADGSPDLVLLTEEGAWIYRNNQGALELDALEGGQFNTCRIDDGQLWLVGDVTRTLNGAFSFDTPNASGAWIQDLDRSGTPDLVLSVSGEKALWMQDLMDPVELAPAQTSGVAGW